MNLQPLARLSRWALLLSIAGTPSAALAASPPMGTLAYLDSAYGFRDVRLGTPFASFHGLQATRHSGARQDCYRRADEDLRLGDGRAHAIRYCFVDERLQAIEIDAVGRENGNALLDVFEAAYGPGQTTRGSVDGAPSVSWRGRQVAASFGDAGDGERVQARLWLRGSDGGGSSMPPRHEPPPQGWPQHEPAAERGSIRLQVSAARQARAGQVTTVAIQYRDATAPARIRVILPPELAVQSSVPSARVEGDYVVWDGLASGSGNLKLKLLIRPEAPVGAVPVLHVEIVDAAGARSLGSAQISVR